MKSGPDGEGVQAPLKSGPKVWQAGTLTYSSTGLVILFLWLLGGDFAWWMRERSVGPMAQWYLKNLGVSNLAYGLLISSLPALITLVLSPIVSVKSDRHRGKWGRRIPYLLVTTPIATLGMIGLALTPLLAGWIQGLFISDPAGAWFRQVLEGNPLGARVLALLQNPLFFPILCFGIFWTAFEIAAIAGQAVIGGLINDVVPRPLLGRFYGLFRAVSLVDGMIFNFWLLGKVPTHYTVILLAISVFYGTAFLLMCLKVREGTYPDPPPRETGGRALVRFFRAGRSYFTECFSRPYYIVVFLMLMMGQLAFVPVNAFSIPFAMSLDSVGAYGVCVGWTYVVSFALAYFLGWLSDKFHPLRVSMVTLVGYILVTIWGGFFASTPATFLTAWFLHGVLSGCYFTSAASLGLRLFPHARYAQFASAAGICLALAQLVISPVVGTIVDKTGNVYRYTFFAGSFLAMLALLLAWCAHSGFMKLGGPRNYVAPE